MASAGHTAAQPVAGTSHWDKYGKGTPDNMSEEQRQILAHFLKEVPVNQMETMKFPSEPPEYFGCRVLRARKYEVAEALKLVAETAKWRTEKRVQELASKSAFEILGCLEDELLGYYPKSYFPLPDKFGRPVYVERSGHIDVDSMFLLTDMERLVDYHIWCTETYLRERFIAQSNVTGRPVTTLVSVLDLEGMSMKQAGAATRSYIARASQLDSAHYPETLGKMLVINAPSFFTAVWALIKVALDERTVRKIEILGGPAAWRPRLVEICGESSIPTEYGGPLKVPGGLFPVSRTRMANLPSHKMLRETVAARGGFTYRFKWFARPGDVRFSVTFFSGASLGPEAAAPPAGGHVVVDPVVPHARAGGVEMHKPTQYPNCDQAFQTVELTAPSDGFFVLAWENNKAWAGRSRDVSSRWDLVVDGRPVENPAKLLAGQ